MQISIELPAKAAAATTARRALDPLRAILDDQPFDDLRLLVTELVTNSYRHGSHGREPIALRVTTRVPSGVHVEVADRGRGFAVREAGAGSGESGWGLRMVNHIASRWGVRTGSATVVWFELD